jgi:Family of unknown function (DUF5994)
MMSGPHLRIVTPPATMATEPPRQTLRLTLKPQAPATGYVDGAWWPRSRDLSTELPALLAVLAVRLGGVLRVSYNLATWDAVPRRLDVNGRQLRLGGFHAQHAHTVDVIGANGACLTLLVLPPGADPVAAHRTMITASRRDNVDSIDHLLAATTAAERATGDDSAEERWEVDGGAARYGS